MAKNTKHRNIKLGNTIKSYPNKSFEYNISDTETEALNNWQNSKIFRLSLKFANSLRYRLSQKQRKNDALCAWPNLYSDHGKIETF